MFTAQTTDPAIQLLPIEFPLGGTLHPMNPEPYNTFARVPRHLGEMRSAHDMAALGRAWADYLTYFRRTWFKVLGVYRVESWWRPLEHAYSQKWHSDPVVNYLLHARNADEHGIRPVAQIQPASTVISGGVIGVGSKFLGGGDFTLGTSTTANVRVKPATVVATSVIDRGVTYDPPPIDGEREPPVIRIAEEGLKFYEALFEDIRRASGP